MTSLKFESIEEIQKFLEREYRALELDAKAKIDNFVAMDTQFIEIDRDLD